jgi:hypothetical protein
MAIGHAAEPVILRLAAERLGIPVRSNRRTFVHWLCSLAATPDAYVLDGAGLVEAKATNRSWIELSDPEPPRDWYWQAIAQLACTGRAYVVIAALAGATFVSWRVDRDREAEAQLVDAIRAFFADYIDRGRLPDSAAPELVFALDVPEGMRAANGTEDRIVREAIGARQRAAAETARYDELRATLTAMMTAARRRTLVGATWRADLRSEDGRPAVLRTHETGRRRGALP